MDKRSFSPTEYQNHVQAKEVDDWLKGAIHVDTHTIDEKRFGGDRTIVIFAFYPDKKD